MAQLSTQQRIDVVIFASQMDSNGNLKSAASAADMFAQKYGRTITPSTVISIFKKFRVSYSCLAIDLAE